LSQPLTDSIFVLVHSPLVGPGTWALVAEELRCQGREAIVPSLLGVVAAAAPKWRHCVDAVRAATERFAKPIVLVGHSGAGPLMPRMADASGKVAALIFVDAMLPPASGHAQLADPTFLSQLRGLANNGLLPPWSEWFGKDAMRRLVPDDGLRAALEREMPRLPLAYFEGTVPMPSAWGQCACAYLLLSPHQYGQSAGDARSRGWLVAEMPGAHHLTIVTDPSAVSSRLLCLEERIVAV